MNGIGMNGIGMNGIGMNGIGMNGIYLNQIGLNGVGFDALGTSQVGTQGSGTNGVIVGGIGLSDVGNSNIGDSSDRQSGAGLRHLAINGLYIDGQGEFGVAVAGTGLLDVGLDGLHVNGNSGIQLNINGTAVDFASEHEDVLETVLFHLVGCALDDDDSVTITSGSGSAKTYRGKRGFAEEWRNGPISQRGEEQLQACLLSSPVATVGTALNGEQEAFMRQLLEYMAQCALTPEQTVTVYGGDGTALTFDGVFGLAPEWYDGPLSQAGELKVSACIGARSNGLGRTVSLSLRHPELLTEDLEAQLFETHEGAFWGNFFAAEPNMQACVVNGGGLSGRVCAESGDCGFLIVGDCADVCTSYDDVNGFGGCGAEQATEVVNTYLNLGTQVTFGETNICDINANQELQCWGKNHTGQLGDGTTQDRTAPVTTAAIGDEVVEAAVSWRHGCARRRNGDLWCWGANESGQVGNGSEASQPTPVRVIEDVASVVAGSRHSCALRSDSSVWCWGDNAAGQLGVDDNIGESLFPLPVTSMSSGVADITSGPAATHTCAVKFDGTAWCWGDNQYGQLGRGNSGGESLAPVQVTNDANGADFGDVTDMCTSKRSSCARKSDGTLWCWGYELNNVPQLVASDVAPNGVSCGEQHVCFVGNDSKVQCFGDNSYGQLGRTTGESSDSTPGPVADLPPVSFLNARHAYTCATHIDGNMSCWGSDPGTAGTHSQVDIFPASLTPTPQLISFE